MASKTENVSYAIRNDIASRLNRSQTGFFLDETLRRGGPHAQQILESSKLMRKLIELLDAHPAIETCVLRPQDGGKERTWLMHPLKHTGQPFPLGYCGARTAISEAVERKLHPTPPIREERGPQLTKADPPPAPNPIVHTSGKVKGTGFFDAMRKAKPPVKPEPVVEELVEEPVEVPAVVQEVQVVVAQVEEQSPIIEEKKELDMTASVAVPPAFANMDPAELANMGKALLDAAKKAEKQQEQQRTLASIKEIQREIAAANATLSRLNDEQLDALDRLGKATEALRLATASL